jgi:dTDP-4-dehydrorhamnose reductase
MPKKLMIFGGSGFVGGNLAVIARRSGWEVHVADNRPHPNLQAEWWLVNITDRDSVKQAIASVNPTAVVNVAAIADIDLAEKERDLAYRVNVDGARYVAENCARKGIRYIFFSSDAVFDGERSSYREDDPPAPLNYYGQTKLEAERAVMDAHPAAVVTRISLVLGFPVTSGNAFFANLESKLTQGKEVIAPTYEIRTPVDVLTLAECVLELCENGFSGVIHIGATDSISRYDLSRAIAKRMGYSEALIKPQTKPEAIPGRAPRHKNGIISVERAQRILKTRLLSTEDSIQRAFDEKLQVESPKPADEEEIS